MPMQEVVALNFMDFTGNLFSVTILWEGGHIQQICCFSAIHQIVAASLVLLQYRALTCFRRFLPPFRPPFMHSNCLSVFPSGGKEI